MEKGINRIKAVLAEEGKTKLGLTEPDNPTSRNQMYVATKKTENAE